MTMIVHYDAALDILYLAARSDLPYHAAELAPEVQVEMAEDSGQPLGVEIRHASQVLREVLPALLRNAERLIPRS